MQALHDAARAIMVGDDLSAHLMKSLLARNPAVESSAIEDIYWGCVQQTLEQGFNIARNAALLSVTLS